MIFTNPEHGHLTPEELSLEINNLMDTYRVNGYCDKCLGALLTCTLATMIINAETKKHFERARLTIIRTLMELDFDNGTVYGSVLKERKPS